MEDDGPGGGPLHRFGGEWTRRKLEVLAKYLDAYARALKNQPFQTAYIDAFAGSGYRVEAGSEQAERVMFPDLAEHEPQALLDGSARLALQAELGFSRYLFIERDRERCAQLELLRAEFPERSTQIDIIRGDANQEIRRLCAKDWRGRRAVMFLDPYGMQVEWSAVEAIARTKSVDLWLLFPLGIGINRLLPSSGEIPDGWRRRIDRFLGSDDWYDEFYRVEPVLTLFGVEEELVKAGMDVIGRYFVRRLETVFEGVAEPGVLRNSSGCPLYLLCFAAANPAGKQPALRIARSLLRDLR
ncbi:MAG: three-Cys-motif partner protein TcmP [Sandaracinaceae bacterium]